MNAAESRRQSLSSHKKHTHTHTSSTITTEPLSSQYPNEWMQSSSLDYGYVVTLNADNN